MGGSGSGFLPPNHAISNMCVGLWSLSQAVRRRANLPRSVIEVHGIWPERLVVQVVLYCVRSPRRKNSVLVQLHTVKATKILYSIRATGLRTHGELKRSHFSLFPTKTSLNVLLDFSIRSQVMSTPKSFHHRADLRSGESSSLKARVTCHRRTSPFSIGHPDEVQTKSGATLRGRGCQTFRHKKGSFVIPSDQTAKLL